MKTCIGSLSGLAIGLLMAAQPVRAADPAYVQILSATVRDQKIDGATVILQKNGQQSVSTTTASNGRAQLLTASADDPTALLIVRKDGYSDLVAKCPCAGMTYAISPVMKDLDGMRVVLNWGHRPDDLDAHLGFGNEHVFFLNKRAPGAILDVDDTTAFGPETITFSRQPGTRYVYTVQNFSGRMAPQESHLPPSGARVYVYVGSTLIRSYAVPTQGAGNLWTVFAISEGGELQDINALSSMYAEQVSQLTPQKIFGAYLNGGGVAASGAVSLPPPPGGARTLLGDPPPTPALPIPEHAKSINTRGETAYRDGRYEQAIGLFREAITQYERYGQAYSNLGLTFQKVGRTAEALWANRKAIALATGPTAPTVRASAYYNNGRIYENREQWDYALREYESAFREKPSATYETAIQRVRREGAR